MSSTEDRWTDGAGRRLHFAGICGVGMAGLAATLARLGWRVDGCDTHAEGSIGQWLTQQGISVAAGHSPDHISSELHALIATPAVAADAPERLRAEEEKLRILSRGEVLSELFSSLPGIAICGAHGKTSTACFTARLLQELGLQPAWCIGGSTPTLGGNAGGEPSSTHPFVVEADESDGTLALYRPEIAVVNAVDLDHHDHFPTEEALVACYQAAIHSTRRGVAYCADSPLATQVAAATPAGVAQLSFGLSENADLRATEIHEGPEGLTFIPVLRGQTLPKVYLPFPGRHNAVNALAAAAAALLLPPSALRSPPSALPPPSSAIFSALGDACSELPGRRFQSVGTCQGAPVIADYAHHPAEIQALLLMARALKPHRLVAIFQPHRYSRTRALRAAFARVFGSVDSLILLPVYAASEPPLPGGHTSALYAEIRAAHPGLDLTLARTPDEAWRAAKAKCAAQDLLLLIGAGDIIALANRASTPSDEEPFTATDCGARHSFYRCGGPLRETRAFTSETELLTTLKLLHSHGKEFRIVGAGANSWFSDAGEERVLLDLGHSDLGAIAENADGTITAPATTTGAALLQFCEERGLSGLEFLDSIPGTIGGMLAMNAGAFGGALGDAVVSLRLAEADGTVRELQKEDCGFGYRATAALAPAFRRLVLGCTLRLLRTNPADVAARRAAFRAKRIPLAGLRTAGSVFKNPAGDSAGRLVEAAGCKGLKVGGAQITQIHANVIATEEGATASDILALVQLAQESVESTFGVRLEAEVAGLA